MLHIFIHFRENGAFSNANIMVSATIVALVYIFGGNFDGIRRKVIVGIGRWMAQYGNMVAKYRVTAGGYTQ
jgi:hypothetical protein